MIAITILSFISYLTYAMVDANVETKDKVTKEDKQIVQGLTAIARIETDFSQIYSPLFYANKSTPTASSGASSYQTEAINSNFDGTVTNGNLIPQIKSEDKSTFIFLSTSNRRKYADSKESRLSWIKYSLVRMENNTQDSDDKTNEGLFNLVRQSLSGDLYNPDLKWDEVREVVMLSRVKELEFSFWNERSKKYTTSITELNELRNSLRSIQVKLIYLDDIGNEQKITKVFRVLYPYFNPKVDQISQTSQQAPADSDSSPNQALDDNNEESENED